MTGPVDFQGTTPSGIPRGALLGVALIAAVLLVSVVKPWDAGPAPAPSPTGLARLTPLPSSLAAPSPTTTAIPAPATEFTLDPPAPEGARWTGLHWIKLAAGHPATSISSVTRWSGGWIALARGGVGGRPTVWSSPEGAVWTRIAEGAATTFWSGHEILAVAPLGSSVVALSSLPNLVCVTSGCPHGSNPFQLTLWSSRDGLRWDPVADVIEPTVDAAANAELQLVGGAAGLVLTVTSPVSEGPAQSTVFVSADGREWRRVDDLPRGFSATSAVVTGDAVILGGSAQERGQTVAAIATSTDLTSWTAELLPALADGPQPQTVWALEAAPAGVLALGSGSDVHGPELWWRADDGVGWAPVPGYPPLGQAECAGPASCGVAANGIVVGDGQRLLALRSKPDWAAWTSDGDSQWERLSADQVGPPSPPANLVLLPGGVLLTTPDGVWYGQAKVEHGGG